MMVLRWRWLLHFSTAATAVAIGIRKENVEDDLHNTDNSRYNANSNGSGLVVDELNVFEVLQVGGFVDSTFCYQALTRADQDKDGRVLPDEYVSLAQDLAPPGLIDSVTKFDELPFAFTSTYRNLACLCQLPTFGGNASATNCCVGSEAHLRVPATAPASQSASSEDIAYLYAVCSLTQGAAESILTSPAPTTPQTPAPSIEPTASPTVLATSLPPSTVPTAEPTAKPTTPIPTKSPAPTTSTPAPTVKPTPAPTAKPTVAPTPAPPTRRVTASVSYTLAIVNGTLYQSQAGFATQYLSDLQVAMDSLAEKVLEPEPADDGKRQRRTRGQQQERLLYLRRILWTFEQVILPTGFENRTKIPCPKKLTGPLDTCEEITASVPLLFVLSSPTDDASQKNLTHYVKRMEADLFNAIYDGALQDELLLIRVDTPIKILTGLDSKAGPLESKSESMTSSAKAGIAVSIAVVVLLIAILIARRRIRPDADDNGKLEYAPYQGEDDSGDAPAGAGIGSGSSRQDSSTSGLLTDAAIQLQTETGGATTLGAAQADYGPAYRQQQQQQTYSLGGSTAAKHGGGRLLDVGYDHLAEPGADVYDESSSNAGSSGWSSSAGISSLNTGSIDDSMDAAAAAGATLATLGAASGLVAARSKRRPTPQSPPEGGGATTATSPTTTAVSAANVAPAAASPPAPVMSVPAATPKSSTSSSVASEITPPVSREQLDSLIEAGDWAAVGATAALLAAASDSESFGSSRSRGTSSRDSGSLDAVRAAELDQLVDAGDWEGVVLAAAKYQTEETPSMRGKDQDKAAMASTSLDSMSADSMTGTATGTGGSPSMSTSISDSPSKAAKRAEIRAEVEALVRRVVPEEIDNVDEMMNQFKGREDELVETLRTMQERAAAQKARAAGHRAAKVKAKQTVQRGVVPGATAGLKSPPPSSGSILASASSSSPGGDPASPQEHRTALELAIERGDWQAVGRAAEALGDRSTTTESTATEGDGARSAEGAKSLHAATASAPSKAAAAQRASEIDHMVDVGDWSGGAGSSDPLSTTGSHDPLTTTVSSSLSNDKDAERRKRLEEEEEEALQQAEIWMKIAEQTKSEGATNTAASDAAEWAIHRSLSQLRQAEMKQSASHETAGASQDEDEV